MTLPAATYDLVLILDPQAEDFARAKIVADTRASIEGGGELLRHDAWGERPLTYPIDRHASGEYHLFQFHRGAAELLDGLDRTLRITDGVLRFRIIKLKPGVPDAPDMGAGTPAARRAEPEAGQPEAAEPAAAEPAPSEPEQPQPSAPEAQIAPEHAGEQSPAAVESDAEQDIPVGDPA